ncbi:MAG TPA: tetratricopeptide repeat protein [Gaiellaceae bacterium]|nr:tetratricopeptide repeat protein [Gaiellaceae bacterium]
MPGALRQWWRYPYGVAGPAALALVTTVALAGAIPALTHKAFLWQLVPGFAVWLIGERLIRIAGRRYARKRDIPPPAKAGPIRKAIGEWIGFWLGGSAAVVAIVLGWQFGWVWTVLAAVMLASQVRRRRKWARLGYQGDPRWALDWSQDGDPAYKYRAFSHLRSGRYEEAQRLFKAALEIAPGDQVVLYNLACAEALEGRSDAAIAHLAEAVSGNKRLHKHARKDPELASIRDDPRFPR